MRIPKGSMRPIKKVLGAALLIAGVGLVAAPVQTANILCEQTIITGIVVAIAGYFHLKSGSRD